MHLRDRAGNDSPEEESEEADQGGVVQEDADPRRDAAPPERVDAGAHRRGDREREEEQGEEDLQLPQGERGHDDPEDDCVATKARRAISVTRGVSP